jgi:hypothetical protein
MFSGSAGELHAILTHLHLLMTSSRTARRPLVAVAHCHLRRAGWSEEEEYDDITEG